MTHELCRRWGWAPRRAILVLGLLSTLWSSAAHAGAWTQEPWHFYAQLGMSYSFGDTERIQQVVGGKVQTIKRPIQVQIDYASQIQKHDGDFQQLLSNLYFELGTVRWLTVFGDFPFLNSMTQKNPGGDIVYEAHHVGDLMLGLRALAIRVPFALAFETRLTFPTGRTSLIIPTGQGDYRGELRLVASKAFERVPIYIDGEFGFTIRSSATIQNDITGFSEGSGKLTPYHPEFYVHAEVGGVLVRWRGMDRLIASVMVDHRQSLDIQPKDLFATIIAESSEFTTVGGTLMISIIKNLGLNLNARGTVNVINLPYITTVGGAIYGKY